jgi:hypothetical protein
VEDGDLLPYLPAAKRHVGIRKAEYLHKVGLHEVEAEGAPGAVELNAQIVFRPRGDLGGLQPARRAARQTDREDHLVLCVDSFHADFAVGARWTPDKNRCER